MGTEKGIAKVGWKKDLRKYLDEQVSSSQEKGCVTAMVESVYHSSPSPFTPTTQRGLEADGDEQRSITSRSHNEHFTRERMTTI